jgi:alpha,alpha-trehalase
VTTNPSGQIRSANIHRFGWVNSSYVFGLQFMDAHARRCLGTLTDWEQFEKATAQISED